MSDVIKIFEVMGHIDEGDEVSDAFCTCVETEDEATDWVRSRCDDLRNERGGGLYDATMAVDIVEIAIPVDDVARLLCDLLDGSILDGVHDQEGLVTRLIDAARYRIR